MGRPGVIPVFVGNISFDTTEEMVRDVFAEVGPVVAVRLVNSKDSGKPKGYGFVEFADMATAESAVRHLNGRELAGRALRVDFAEHPDGSRVVVGTRRGALSAPERLSVSFLIPLQRLAQTAYAPRRPPLLSARGEPPQRCVVRHLLVSAALTLSCSRLACLRRRLPLLRWRQRMARHRLPRSAVLRPARLPTCLRCGCLTCRRGKCTRSWRRPRRWRPRTPDKHARCSPRTRS